MSNESLYVEQPALEQLQSLGYTYIPGKDLAPDSKERNSFYEVILHKRLRDFLRKINPWLNEENLNRVVRDITYINKNSLIEANQFIHDKIVKYSSYEQDLGKGRKHQTVRIIDFDDIKNNEFIVSNQFTVESAEKIIIDIVIFINGLPVVVIECKAPDNGSGPIESAIEQLLRYSNQRQTLEPEGCSKLFFYNQLMIATCGIKAKVGTISSSYKHYLDWKDPYPVKSANIENKAQTILLTGMLQHRNLLDLIQNFMLFEVVQGKLIKKVARYQQFRSVHKAINRLKSSNDRKQRGGVIWHTQGGFANLKCTHQNGIR